jgi:hypothetical protein
VAPGEEVLRVLKPGRTLVVIAESYKNRKYDWFEGPAMKLLKSAHLSGSEHRELFSTTGYQHIQMFAERKKVGFAG